MYEKYEVVHFFDLPLISGSQPIGFVLLDEAIVRWWTIMYWSSVTLRNVAFLFINFLDSATKRQANIITRQPRIHEHSFGRVSIPPFNMPFFCSINLALVVAYRCVSGWEIGQEVSTTSGLIDGHASSWQLEVSEYLGIPFAQPPIGSLRFAAPQTYQGYGRIVADHYVSFHDTSHRLSLTNSVSV